MTEPLIRVYLTSSGVLRIDAPVATLEDREKAFELTARALPAIRQLNATMRGGAVAD